MRRRKPDPAAVAAPDDAGGARLAALRLLNRRDYAAADLAARLVERGFDRAAVDQAIAGLRAERLLDDERYAGLYVRWQAERGQGPVRIAMQLREAGIEPELVAAVVDAGDRAWQQRCAEVRRRRFGGPPPAEWKERGRQARFLSYRGFSADQVRAALGADVDLDE